MRVQASSLDQTDLWLLERAKSEGKNSCHSTVIAGRDVVGIVEEVGSHVEALEVGDKVSSKRYSSYSIQYQ